MGTNATFRFYEELNDFLPDGRRRRDFEVDIDRARSVKDAIESVGVPHPEVDLILVDGLSVDFAHVLRGGERVAVYPMFESLDVSPLQRLRNWPLRDPRFIADGHLAKLARHLRMAGFDTLWHRDWDDDRIVESARDERRTILTRDKAMLRRGDVERGYFVRNTESEAQLGEVVARLQLGSALRPFTRCRECNTELEAVAQSEVQDRLPEKVRGCYERFKRCAGCDRVYWEGTHFQRMNGLLGRLQAEIPSDAA
ncbi:MAG TPA: Mut7-C RNAse domain-containing protein [Usitatibacter sp.]|nr:Mut7-C RNAse domain-containing protein [Usitatibacter sp.]